MSLGQCLPGLVEEGKLSADQADDARALYDELIAEHTRSGSPEAAEATASKAVIDALERNVTRKEFLAGRTIKVRQRIAADLASYGNGAGGTRPPKNGGNGAGGPIDPRGAAALIDHDPRAPYSNVEARRMAVLGDAHRMMDGVLAKHSANLLGQVRKKADLRAMVREVFGEDSGNHAARELADGWRQTAEMLRVRRNQAGGDTGFRADWGLPQSHNFKAVRKAGYEAWKADILPRLDRAKMVDNRTGQRFTAEGLELALREVFETIRTDGANTMTPGAPGGKAMANQRAEGRFLVFKSADDWMDYAENFGSGTAYDAMIGHMEQMSREIAAMEVLGPNPDGTLRWIKDSITQSAKLDTSPDSKAIQRAESAGKKVDRLWDEYRGANMGADNETLALVFSNIRSWQVATKLGGAYLTAASDFAFQQARRSFNGLGRASVLPQYIKLMKPGSLADQKLAIRRGLIADEYAQRTAATSRYLMEEMTGEFARRTASGVLRLSLLSRHTQMMRWVYGMESLSTYTEQAGKALAELEPPLRNALERYGIDAAGWDQLRTAPMDVDRGVEWISPHNLEDRDLASRFMEMIHSETNIAVPVADLGTRAQFNSKLERGTVIGEIGRSAVLFKSFGVSVMIRQAGEILAMQPATAAKYAGGLLIGTTLTGALTVQLRAVGAGKDPRPMDDDEFWKASLLQGGGFGIFGDFLFAAESRAGSGLAMTLGGPIVSDIQKIYDTALADDPRTKIVRTTKGFLPGNNLWYTRAAFDRMVADQIEEAVNPDYRKSWKRMDRYAADQGTEYYWGPGDALPERAPDFANALAEGPDDD